MATMPIMGSGRRGYGKVTIGYRRLREVTGGYIRHSTFDIRQFKRPMRVSRFTIAVLVALSMGMQVRSQNYLVVHMNDTTGPVISKHIYGHFSEHLGRCIYEGFWVGEGSAISAKNGIRQDVVEALKEVKIPNLRWPGGCFADTYHWKDGVGPQTERAKIINTHWGGVTEDNSFGTHEFMELCEQLGTEAFISGNMGSGSVEEMAQWVEYLTSANESPMTDWRKRNGREEPWKVAFWGLGNEPWGCGGNMNATFYADEMRRYSTYSPDFSGNRMTRIACSSYGSDVSWTEVLMKDPLNRRMFQGLSIHLYTQVNGWGDKRSATGFGEEDWFMLIRNSLRMKDAVEAHARVMDRYDPEKRIGLYVDEWGNWYDVEPETNPGFLYQQNSLRDALTTAINLHIFQDYADRVKGANLAQTVNVLQALILTDGARMVLTPTYYVFRMLRAHQDARRLTSQLISESYRYGNEQIPALTASASRDSAGVVHLSVTNSNPNKSIPLKVDLVGQQVRGVTGRIVTADQVDAHNRFGEPERVTEKSFNGFKIKNQHLEVDIPSKSVIMLTIK